MSVVFVGLGGNKGDVKSAFVEAVQLFRTFGRVIGCSSLYLTSPQDGVEGGMFLNAVCKLELELSPWELLEKVLSLQRAMGKQGRLEPRILDIDILAYDREVIKSRGLEIPHPRMHLRRFVLEPLWELDPDFVHPVLGKKVEEMLGGLEGQGRVERQCNTEDWWCAS